MERDGQKYSYHRDALSSITEVTDSDGLLVESYLYDVFGAPLIFDANGLPLATSAIGNPYLFTGREYDPESSNYNYRSRMHQPDIGRFMQMDPSGFADGSNLYTYVHNGPTNWVDPWGQQTVDLPPIEPGNQSIPNIQPNIPNFNYEVRRLSPEQCQKTCEAMRKNKYLRCGKKNKHPKKVCVDQGFGEGGPFMQECINSCTNAIFYVRVPTSWERFTLWLQGVVPTRYDNPDFYEPPRACMGVGVRG